ncbi:MAG: DUF4340 domain-containing protein [Verrucomicrobiales bacterium]
MNTKTTWGLGIAAILMFLYIVLFEHPFFGGRQKDTVPEALPNFNPGLVESIQVKVTNSTFQVNRTAEGWKLAKPVYPAQTTPIESLLLKLDELRKLDVIPAKEVQAQGGLKAFGLEPPRATIILQGGGQQNTLLIGAPTPLTQQIYMQVFGSADVLVADASITSYVPTTPTVWRNPMLLQFENLNFDTIYIRSGSRVVELEQNATNKLWHITKPIPARADQERIAVLLQNLRTSRIGGFIGDAAGMDLEKFGLQAPEVTLSFLNGTNVVTSVEFGNSPTNNPSLVVARKVNDNALVMVNQPIVESLKQPYKNFHESRLLSFNMNAIDQIEIKSIENFTLARQQNRWMVKGPFEGMADPGIMQEFLTNLAAIEIVDFAKDVPTDVDLKNYLLAPPLISYGLFRTHTNDVGLTTNVLATSVDFGTNQLDTIYVRRSDEAPVYITRYADMLLLPKRAFELRNRLLWSLDQTNIFGLQLSAQGATNRLSRDASRNWSADAVANAAIAENIFRLANLHVISWVSKGDARLRLFGINKNSPRLQVETIQGGDQQKLEITVGNRTPSGNFYASTFLADLKDQVVFEFPGPLLTELVQMFALAEK